MLQSLSHHVPGQREATKVSVLYVTQALWHCQNEHCQREKKRKKKEKKKKTPTKKPPNKQTKKPNQKQNQTKKACCQREKKNKRKKKAQQKTKIKKNKVWFLVAWPPSNMHSLSHVRFCLENCTYYHTEIEAAHQTCYSIQLCCTDTIPISPRVEPLMPGVRQGSQESTNLTVRSMIWLGLLVIDPLSPFVKATTIPLHHPGSPTVHVQTKKWLTVEFTVHGQGF